MEGRDFAFPMYDPQEKHLYPGLTKREYMIIEFTKAIVNGQWSDPEREVDRDDKIAVWAIELTDTILKLM